MQDHRGDRRTQSMEYLVQHLSVAVQWWNCIAVLGSTGYSLLVYVLDSFKMNECFS